jgi:hypothetical protein
LGVTNIEIRINAISAQTYQQEFWAQSAIGPATVQPHINRFVPGHESLRNGIFNKEATLFYYEKSVKKLF